ncbi:THUMP domain-containing class I SAM-dependent RNA methyltransferase [Calorimonas adulescens]|uniref:Class I SAM-dependent RNA methyltransferase n=1 Tax=Calorimonas adulescens TaxID=2606906 RepID=A0A5D8QEG8_9THEO|nr:class I SAM-dependent RNA methyltransferase [Calorimonas adulescens]TZE82574.1 class I SAM-dependent RNA methyltransferase [Calorimonas adulescens]
MAKIDLIATTLLGVESIVAKEIRKLGYKDVTVEDGRVTFTGDEMAICRANLWLRSAERVLVKLGEFKAETFDELFEGTKAMPWADWLPVNAAFPVNGYSLRSKLFSIPDCQAIVKKAIVESMKKRYRKEWFEEDGPQYKIHFGIIKDRATLMIDTSGPSLHKRGYREISNEAPLRETLAAAMIEISKWKPEIPLSDPFCGSGTIPIEAALIGTNTAPGINREFISEKWERLPERLWKGAREEALSLMRPDSKLNIMGSDIDGQSVKLSRSNARKAGMEKYISFKRIDIRDIFLRDKNGYIICNPPYGERMGEKDEVENLYRDMGMVFKDFDGWSYFILSAHEEFEKLFGQRADKKRKLYNGMIKCYLYQYYNNEERTQPGKI